MKKGEGRRKEEEEPEEWGMGTREFFQIHAWCVLDVSRRHVGVCLQRSL